MSNNKRAIAKLLMDMPDDCTFEDFQYRLYVAETIRRREASLGPKTFVSQAEAKKRMKKWLSK